MTINRRTFLQAAGLSVVGAGLGMTGAGWAFHNDGLPLVQPSYGDIAGLEILGFNDGSFGGLDRRQGWDRVFDFRVIENGNGRFAYCPNQNLGWSVVDASNPRHMRVVFRQPHSTLPDNTQYLDIKGGRRFGRKAKPQT